MKSKTSTSSLSSAPRCEYRTATGRQCCSWAEARSGLCARHAAAQEKTDARDYAGVLIRESAGFQTAEGINYSLGDLYALLAQGRISPRRAAVLAHISSLLLRTLPAMDKEACPEANRIIDLGTGIDLVSNEEATEEKDDESETRPDLSHADSGDVPKDPKPN